MALTDNNNLFQPTGFRVIIDRKQYGNFEFFCQSVSHPSVTLNAVEVPYSRIGSIPMPGDSITFGDITLNVLLDEDFNSYTEIYDWLLFQIQNPQLSTPQNRSADRNSGRDGLKKGEDRYTFADITVIALSSHNNKNKTIKYKDAHPTSLGDLNFEAMNQSVEYITFPVSFRFTSFEIS